MHKKQNLRHSLKSNDKKHGQKGYSLYHLNQINTKLQNQQVEAKKFIQKMKQERHLSRKMDKVVQQQIEKVQTGGVYFASRLEEEKRKHNLLSTLVAHYESIIYQDKLEKHNEMMKTKTIFKNKKQQRDQSVQLRRKQSNQNQTSRHNQFEQSNQILKQAQKDYDQIILKNNTAQYELSKKLDQVRVLRSQRTVFNQLFDQFEKQIFDHQFKYKQLVIQRTFLQNSFKHKIHQFEEIQMKAEKSFQKIYKNEQKKMQTSRINFAQQITTKKQISNVNLSIIENNQQKSPTFQQSARKRSFSNNKLKQSMILSARINTQGNDILKNEMSDNTKLSTATNKAQTVEMERKVNFRSSEIINSQKINSSRFKNNLYLNRNNSRHHPNNRRSQEKQTQNSKIYQQMNNLQYEKKVKQIYQDLNIKNHIQLTKMKNNLQQDIQNLYKQAQNLYQMIYFRQNGNNLNENENKNYRQDTKRMNKIKKCQQLKEIFKRTNIQHKNIQNQFYTFLSNDIKQVYKVLGIQQQTINQQKQNKKQLSKQQILQQFNSLQKLFEKIITLPQRQKNKTQYLHSIHYAQQHLVEQQSSKRDTHKHGADIKCELNTEKLKQSFMRQKQTNQYDNSKLQQILKVNRNSGNNNSITIYSEQELIEKSRLDLSKIKKRNQSSGSYQTEIYSISRNNKFSGYCKPQEKQNIQIQ